MTLGVLLKVGAAGPAFESSTGLLVGGGLLPKEMVEKLRGADEAVREAEAAVQRMRTEAAAELDSIRQKAFILGYAQGHAQGVATVLGELEAGERLRRLLSQRLAEAVERALLGLLGELGPAEVLRLRVLHLLRLAGEAGGAAAVLRVHPDRVAQAQAVLRATAPEDAGPLAGLDLVADAARPPESLLLETRLGFIESDLETTLADLRDIVRFATDRAARAMGAT